jgi:hypothetical protein
MTSTKKNKVFISGKVSGMNHNKAWGKFAFAEYQLSKKGYWVENPMKFCKKHWSWWRCMFVCFCHLAKCKYMVQLDNWQDSKGAKWEYKWAKWLGVEIITL